MLVVSIQPVLSEALKLRIWLKTTIIYLKFLAKPCFRQHLKIIAFCIILVFKTIFFNGFVTVSFQPAQLSPAGHVVDAFRHLHHVFGFHRLAEPDVLTVRQWPTKNRRKKGWGTNKKKKAQIEQVDNIVYKLTNAQIKSKSKNKLTILLTFIFELFWCKIKSAPGGDGPKS